MTITRTTTTTSQVVFTIQVHTCESWLQFSNKTKFSHELLRADILLDLSLFVGNLCKTRANCSCHNSKWRIYSDCGGYYEDAMQVIRIKNHNLQIQPTQPIRMTYNYVFIGCLFTASSYCFWFFILSGFLREKAVPDPL